MTRYSAAVLTERRPAQPHNVPLPSLIGDLSCEQAPTLGCQLPHPQRHSPFQISRLPKIPNEVRASGLVAPVSANKDGTPISTLTDDGMLRMRNDFIIPRDRECGALRLCPRFALIYMTAV